MSKNADVEGEDDGDPVGPDVVGSAVEGATVGVEDDGANVVVVVGDDEVGGDVGS